MSLSVVLIQCRAQKNLETLVYRGLERNMMIYKVILMEREISGGL